MNRWALGGDLSVARIGYGAMKLTGRPQGDRPSRETALAILRRAVELGVNYNLSKRDDDPLVDACADAGIAYVPYFPVGGFQPIKAGHLDAIAARHGATVPQVALAWLPARSPNILAIPGTGSLAHLEENVAAGTLKLSEEDLAQLG